MQASLSNLTNAGLDERADEAKLDADCQAVSAWRERIDTLIGVWNSTGRDSGALPESVQDRVDMWGVLTAWGTRAADPNPAKVKYKTRQTTWQYACRVATELGLRTPEGDHAKERPASWAVRDCEEGIEGYETLHAISPIVANRFVVSNKLCSTHESERIAKDGYLGRINWANRRYVEDKFLDGAVEFVTTPSIGEPFAMPVLGNSPRMVTISFPLYAAGETMDSETMMLQRGRMRPIEPKPIGNMDIRVASASLNLTASDLAKRLELYAARAAREEATAIPDDIELLPQEEQDKFLELQLKQEELAKPKAKLSIGLASRIKRS